MNSAPGPAVKALTDRADAALRLGDAAGALRLLREAEAAAPGDAAIKAQKALALRLTGDLHGALEALDQALAIEPYFLMALLSKGFILEKLGQPRVAAQAYRNALAFAPADAGPALAAPLARAREVVEANDRELEAFLARETAKARARHAGADLDRFDEALAIYAGRLKPAPQQPLLLHYPELPPIQYYPRALFPWMERLEAATGAIQAELKVVLEEDWGEFNPYIQYPSGAPVNQWKTLNHSSLWSTFFLWKDGVKNAAHCARCPNTAALLESLPMADQAGFAPTAMFSVLQPRTHIPAHTGSSNIRLICHLPLILPGNCRFRVGNRTREWKMGEAFVFDDTIEHEAWNDSDEVRVVMIFDVWNPFLEPAERELITAMMTAKNRFVAGEG